MRPESYTFFPRKSDGDVDVQAAKTVTRDIPGHGMFWEADAVARCLRDGKKEADLCPLGASSDPGSFALSLSDPIIIFDSHDAAQPADHGDGPEPEQLALPRRTGGGQLAQ